MSKYTPPVPNNLTLVRFGPVGVDFTVAGSTEIGQLEYDENIFVPTGATIVWKNVIGTIGTSGSVSINNKTSNDNLFPALTLSSQTGTQANLTQTVFAAPTALNNYVLGSVPVSTQVPSNGAAAVQNITVDVTTQATCATTISSGVTANNITTLTLNALPTGAVAGAYIKVNTSVAGYGGLVTILSTGTNTISYYNPSIASGTFSGTGQVGALYGDVIVTGYLF